MPYGGVSTLTTFGCMKPKSELQKVWPNWNPILHKHINLVGIYAKHSLSLIFYFLSECNCGPFWIEMPPVHLLTVTSMPMLFIPILIIFVVILMHQLSLIF